MVRGVAVLVLVSGCFSFFTMRSPHGTPPECEESRTSPALDTAVTIAAPLLVYLLLAANNSDPPKFGEAPSFEIVAALVVTSPVMAVTGTSAVFGFIKADRCERAKRDYQQLMNAPPPGAPPPMGPPPPAALPPSGPPPPTAPVTAPPEGGPS